MNERSWEDEGRSAFPCMEEYGMTLRDWFAGQALVQLIIKYKQEYGSSTSLCDEIAREAYSYADVMLTARAK